MGYKDDEPEWDIIYPNRVYDAVNDRAKQTKMEGFKSGMSLLCIFSVIGFFALSALLQNVFGISGFWALLIVLIFVLLIAVTVFRFFIFKEDDKLEEFENEDWSNLGRYFQLVNDTEDVEVFGKLEVPMYKFMGGQFAVCLRLPHGSCDAVKRKETKFFMEDIATIIYKNNLSYKQIIMDENFTESREWRNYTNRLNNMQDSNMKKYAIEIADFVGKTAEDRSRVDCTFIIIYGKNAYEKQYMAAAVYEILAEFNKTNTVFRSIDLLKYLDFINVCIRYLGIDTLDLSTVRATGVNAKVLAQYYDLVQTVEVETTDDYKIVYDSSLTKKIAKVKDL